MQAVQHVDVIGSGGTKVEKDFGRCVGRYGVVRPSLLRTANK
jgi:hypothetical protein